MEKEFGFDGLLVIKADTEELAREKMASTLRNLKEMIGHNPFEVNLLLDTDSCFELDDELELEDEDEDEYLDIIYE